MGRGAAVTNILGIDRNSEQRIELLQEARRIPLLAAGSRHQTQSSGLFRPKTNRTGSAELELLFWASERCLTPVRLARMGNMRQTCIVLTPAGHLLAITEAVTGVHRLQHSISLLYHGDSCSEAVAAANASLALSEASGFTSASEGTAHYERGQLLASLGRLGASWPSESCGEFPGSALLN